MDVKLTKPLELEPAQGDTPAKTLASLTLRLDGLTGADVELCAREALVVNGGAPPTVLALDLAFQVQVAARASGVPAEALKRLGATDYLAVTQAVQNFLLGSG